MAEVFIFDAVRTPRGKGRPGGSLENIAPADLVGTLVTALKDRNGSEAVEAANVFALGTVTQTGDQGGHLGLASRIQAGMPDTMAAITLNNFCVSGLSAIIEGTRRIITGEANLALAGGVESMSRIPFLKDKAPYYTDLELARRMGWMPVGVAADLLAARKNISRQSLDEMTLLSHRRAAKAWADGHYADRVVPVHDKDGQLALGHDENIRDFGDGQKLAAYPPVFQEMGQAGFEPIAADHHPDLMPMDYIHSIANCPPISDGAAMALIGSREQGEALGLKAVAKIKSFADVSGDPVLQLTAGMSAMDTALQRAGLGLDDMDVIEFMESFAVVPVMFHQERQPDPDKVNVLGGHLGMGHPMGASGAILLTTLLASMKAKDAQYGLVVTTGGVGVGAAMVLERV